MSSALCLRLSGWEVALQPSCTDTSVGKSARSTPTSNTTGEAGVERNNLYWPLILHSPWELKVHGSLKTGESSPVSYVGTSSPLKGTLTPFK